MKKIQQIQPLLDDQGNIIPKQESCATCKKRLACQLFIDTMEEHKRSNEYAEIILSMYYKCEEYIPMFIQYPIIVESITSDLSYDSHNLQTHVGEYVIVSINAKNYDEDIHLGLYLGDLPISIISLFDSKTKEIRNKFMKNPAIYVFKFHKIFYGMNCRWQFITKNQDLDLIHEDDPQEYISIAKAHLYHSSKK